MKEDFTKAMDIFTVTEAEIRKIIFKYCREENKEGCKNLEPICNIVIPAQGLLPGYSIKGYNIQEQGIYIYIFNKNGDPPLKNADMPSDYLRRKIIICTERIDDCVMKSSGMWTSIGYINNRTYICFSISEENNNKKIDAVRWFQFYDEAGKSHAQREEVTLERIIKDTSIMKGRKDPNNYRITNIKKDTDTYIPNNCPSEDKVPAIFQIVFDKLHNKGHREQSDENNELFLS